MWLMCSECGATLPSSRARCPVCGRQPAPDAAPSRRRRIGPVLVILGVLAGAATAALVLKPPLVTSWVDSTGLTSG
jgi:hypothetical protein